MKSTLNQCLVNENTWSSRREDTPLGHQNACSERQHSYGEGMILHIKNNSLFVNADMGHWSVAEYNGFLQGGFYFSYFCMLPEVHANILRLPQVCYKKK